MREELQWLLSDKPLSDRKRTQREKVEAYVQEFQKKFQDLQSEYGLTYKASLQYSQEGIAPTLQLVPFNPDRLTEATESPEPISEVSK